MALFAELSSSPVAMEGSKFVDAYCLFNGQDIEQADAEQAYTQAEIEGTPTCATSSRPVAKNVGGDDGSSMSSQASALWTPRQWWTYGSSLRQASTKCRLYRNRPVEIMLLARTTQAMLGGVRRRLQSSSLDQPRQSRKGGN